MLILVASKNPVKIAAVTEAFRAVFPHKEIVVEGLGVESGVKDQPDTDEETIAGAQNRIRALRVAGRERNADYFAALEGGVEWVGGKLFAFAWVLVENRRGLSGEARTAAYEVPPPVARLIREGVELGIANDRVFGTENSKQKNGNIGLLTGDLVTRTSNNAQAAMLALIPFGKHAVLYDATAKSS
jgi:inosine/xanthosine triphosphatase